MSKIADAITDEPENTYYWVMKLEDEVIKLEADNRHLKAINKELLEALEEYALPLPPYGYSKKAALRLEKARAAIAKALADGG